MIPVMILRLALAASLLTAPCAARAQAYSDTVSGRYNIVEVMCSVRMQSPEGSLLVSVAYSRAGLKGVEMAEWVSADGSLDTDDAPEGWVVMANARVEAAARQFISDGAPPGMSPRTSQGNASCLARAANRILIADDALEHFLYRREVEARLFPQKYEPSFPGDTVNCITYRQYPDGLVRGSRALSMAGDVLDEDLSWEEAQRPRLGVEPPPQHRESIRAELAAAFDSFSARTPRESEWHSQCGLRYGASEP